MKNLDIKTVWDEKGSIGTGKDHYVFPEGKDRTSVALHSAVTGGIYIRKDADTPETITITLTGRV